MSKMAGVWKNLRSGREYDVYVTIGVAVIVAILSFLDVISAAKVTSLLLAVLAIIAYNTLGTRSAIEQLKDSTSRGVDIFNDFPEELRSRRADSFDTFLIGVNLARTIETSYSAFEGVLRRGGRIRILLTDPESDESAICTQAQASKPDAADIRREIEQSMGRLRKLAPLASSRGPGEGLEVRKTKIALKFGLNYVDIGSHKETIYVQMYSFRLPGESRPILRLGAVDGEWFECYRLQAECLWSESVPVDFELGAPIERSVP